MSTTHGEGMMWPTDAKGGSEPSDGSRLLSASPAGATATSTDTTETRTRSTTTRPTSHSSAAAATWPSIGGLRPYYQDDLVVILHGDCRDLLPSIEADVIVTDPPYGVRAQHKAHAASSGPVVSWDDEYPHDVINGLVERGLAVVAFGAAISIKAELMAFVGDPRVAIWNPKFRLGMSAKDGLAYRYHPIYLWGIHTKPTVRDVFDAATEAGNWWYHPASKPVLLTRDVIAKCPPGTILDPFMGSGTTLVAAKSLNRHAIGIEIEERYCEIAATRCSQGVLGLETA